MQITKTVTVLLPDHEAYLKAMIAKAREYDAEDGTEQRDGEEYTAEEAFVVLFHRDGLVSLEALLTKPEDYPSFGWFVE